MKTPIIITNLLLFTLMMLKNANAQNSSNINFEISFTEPQAHYVDVQMTIDNISTKSVTIKMPVWAPGSYLVREFSKNVESLQVADSKGKPLSFEKTAKNSWKINSLNTKKIVVNYRVYAFEVSVRTSFVDADQAFLSPPDVFMYVDGQLAQSATVKILPRQGWGKISTALTNLTNQSHTFYAANFDQLFDSPIEVGNQDVFYFDAAGVKHEVAMVKGGNYDAEKLKVDMAKIVEAETAIFGENPNKRYVFIIHNYASGGGGLEHESSTVLGAKRTGYTDEATYKDFLSLVAHEYFHLWNVKRLRPKALGPFDYDKENYTTNLWVAEGFTAYYENLICKRTGIITEEDYLTELAKNINTIANQPGNKVQSVSDASFNAWIKYYRPNENSSNSSVSYYNKGALVASVIDLAIIQNSQGKYSLDDAMKFAYGEYYKKLKRGYTDAEFRIVLEKFAGKPLKFIYDNYINGTADIDFSTYLGFAGLKVVDTNVGVNTAYLGANTALINDRLIIRSVARNSAAYLSGLNVNDIILSIDGTKPDNLSKFIAEKKPADILKFVVDRDGIEKTIDVKLKANPNKNFVIHKMEEMTDLQKIILNKWLR